MRPLNLFRAHFQAAEALLKVYQLLDSDPLPDQTVRSKLWQAMRDAVGCDPSESLDLLLNDLFVGMVREQANVSPSFFMQPNLALLLRQAVVSACTALDVYFPALLDLHLPAVVRVRQRNFLPAKGEVKSFFKDFRLKLEEIPALLEEEESGRRWNILARLILDYCHAQTLSNVDSISATMLILGTEEPWKRIAARTGMSENSLRTQVKNLSARRNDVVHRGDRPASQPDAPPQPIDYTWTSSHVDSVKRVVDACDALAEEAVQELLAEAGVA